MLQYIQFPAADGSTILVETDEKEDVSQRGVVKAGLKGKLHEAVALAQTTFEDALERAVQCNAEAFRRAITSLKDPPSEAEMSFALKATGEVGNVAVGKLGGESNYTIKLVWKGDSKKED